MKSTNYTNTFIAVAPDSAAACGLAPAKAGTIAAMQYTLLSERPYHWTSDELLFEIHRRRHEIPASQCAEARREFFARPHACLRASPLVKQYGWGLHHDANARIALYGVGSSDYRRLAASPELTVVAGMRSKRAEC